MSGLLSRLDIEIRCRNCDKIVFANTENSPRQNADLSHTLSGMCGNCKCISSAKSHLFDALGRVILEFELEKEFMAIICDDQDGEKCMLATNGKKVYVEKGQNAEKALEDLTNELEDNLKTYNPVTKEFI
jgi:hypothetical protein